MTSRLLTVPEVAERLNAKRSFVYQIIHERQIRVHKLGPNPKSPVRIDSADLDAWLARHRVEVRVAS